VVALIEANQLLQKENRFQIFIVKAEKSENYNGSEGGYDWELEETDYSTNYWIKLDGSVYENKIEINFEKDIINLEKDDDNENWGEGKDINVEKYTGISIFYYFILYFSFIFLSLDVFCFLVTSLNLF
jgi:hypothetical protein